MFNIVEMAERLKGVRKAKALNQKEFGALGGVGLQTQSRYENAETEPSASYLAGLSESGIDVQFVLTGKKSVSSLATSDGQSIDVSKLLIIESWVQGLREMSGGASILDWLRNE